jgi:hypothetical protein
MGSHETLAARAIRARASPLSASPVGLRRLADHLSCWRRDDIGGAGYLLREGVVKEVPAHLQTLIDRGAITIDAHGVVRVTHRTWRLMTAQGALHFVGFKDDRYWSAVKVWGKPNFVHRHWDYRAKCEVVPGDVAIFAKGDETDEPTLFAYDDSAYF